MKKRFLFTLSLLLYVTICYAYPTWPTRVDGICYQCNDDDMTARVVYPFNYQGELIQYVGDIVIPEEIAPNRPDFKYTVTEIDWDAFANSVTTSVVIPKTIKAIPSYCFRYCSNLTSVTIYYGVREIGDGAFATLQRLEKVVFSNNAAVSYDGRCAIGENAFRECRNLKSVYMGPCVRSIGANAFSDCNALTSVTMENGMNIIEYYAFRNCSALTSVNIPNSVTYIGPAAFLECSSLKTVHMGNSVTSIGDDAFDYCHSLSAVHITDLSAWCNINFANWSSNPLSYAGHLYLNGNEIKDLVIPDGVTTISQLAFSNCMGLTSITIPNSVTNIGDDAFSWCSSLTSVTIPNSVTNIGDDAFSWCSSLTSVTIGNGVTSIGPHAFYRCSNLNEVYCLTENVPDTGYNLFGESPIVSATLYVPKESVDAYSTTSPWSEFGKIVGLTQDMIDGIKAIDNESLTPALSKGEGEWYSLDGRKLGGKPMKSGLYINNGRKVVVK